MKNKLFNVLKESNNAFELHWEIYKHLYPTHGGPSISSSCDGEEIENDIQCGCWVHSLIRWIKED